MTQTKPLIKVEDGDGLATKLLQLSNELKPIDDENFFFEIVRELVDAALTNYRHLRQRFVESNYPSLAWACRNLLELTIFLKYVLASASNARRFGDDRLVDRVEMITSVNRSYGAAGTGEPSARRSTLS